MWCFSHDPLLCPPPVALVIYLPRKVYTYALHIFSLSIYPMKLHEFFFFLQALAGIFFSSSIPCMNFFFGSDTPPPRMSNGPPLRGGPLDILGGGVSDPKKKFIQEIELEKKIPACA